MSVFRNRLQLELEIEGKGRFPIVQVGTDSLLNSIPTASCLLATGRKMSDGTTVSPAHKGVWSLRKKDKAKVYMIANGPYDDTHDWPTHEVMIFEGRIEGVGKQMMLGKLFLSVHLTHWLSYLDSASVLNASTHPNNPIQYSFAAVVNKNIMAGSLPQPMGIAQTAMAAHFVTDWASVGNDLWGLGFKTMFSKLLDEKQLAFSSQLEKCIPNLRDTIRHPDMMDALTRISGETKRAGHSSALPSYAPKLAMLGAGGFPKEVVRALANAVGNEGISTFGSQSMWGKLIQYASSFMFSVVPLVDKALVVPFIPTNRNTYDKTIEATDDEVEQFNIHLNKSIRAVAVYNSVQSATGTESAIGTEGVTGLAGCFAPNNADERGVIWTVPAPGWLANLRADGFSPTRSSGAKLGTRGSSTTPSSIKSGLTGSTTPKATIYKDTGDLFNAYAHAVYALDVLRGRNGQLRGKLRFDISPGSIVRIKSTGEPFIIDDELHNTLIGVVTGVSVGLNSESAEAGTSFQIEYFRTEEENEEDATSTDGHPFYTDCFRGAPLIEDLKF